MTSARCLWLVLGMSACASPPPMGCTDTIDSSGRGIPYCTTRDHVPVCDAEGQMAHFAGSAASSLEGGEFAVCDTSNQLVCPDARVSPRCIPGPRD